MKALVKKRKRFRETHLKEKSSWVRFPLGNQMKISVSSCWSGVCVNTMHMVNILNTAHISAPSQSQSRFKVA